MPKRIDNNVPRLPGSGVRRDLKDTWASIVSKTQESPERNNTEARIVGLDRLIVNPNQPRRVFDPEREAELAADVKVRGILEPLIVRPLEEDDKGQLYQIVAGERRYRAAKAAELKEIPVMVKQLNDQDARLVSLVENLQRQDLHPEDEARYFNLLIEQYNLSYKEIAGLVHRSPTYVSDRMKMLPSKPAKIKVEASNDESEPLSDSEKNHLHTDYERKLKKSQSNTTFAFRPVVRFRSFLTQTREQLPQISSEDKATLLQEIKELRHELEELEKATKSS